MKDMSPRERAVTALSRRQLDRVPEYAGFSDPMLEMFKKKTGSNSPKDYFKMEMRYVLFKPEFCSDQGTREARESRSDLSERRENPLCRSGHGD